MADRYPLVANPDSNQIQEIASFDNLNLTNNGIVGATTITANQFIGDLVGTATTADFLSNAGNIVTGIINPGRLRGTYDIGVTTSLFLTNASNILSGTVPRGRLDGTYDINVTGSANTANFLTDGSQILDGVISNERLSGVYNIDITGTAFNAVGAATSISVQDDRDSAERHFLLSTRFTDTDSSAVTDSNSLVYIPSTNSLGVGTGVPTSNIDIRGDGLITGNLQVNNVNVSSRVNAGIVSASQLVNIAGIDSTTKLTFEESLGINDLAYLTVAGVTTLSNFNSTGQAELNNLNVSGIATFQSIRFSSSSGSIFAPKVEVTDLVVSGISSLSSVGIGITVVITENRELFNIKGIDNVTRDTLVDILDIRFFEDLATSGVGTIIGKVDITNGIDVQGQTTLEDINVTGIATFSNLDFGNVNTITFNDIDLNDLNASGIVTALRYFGEGSSLTGIVTSIIAGVGISVSPVNGKGEVTVSAFRPVGKTIFVSQLGNDLNSGLSENDTKRTIKAAAAISLPGDTIKVFPGIYVENNPIVLGKGVAVEGAELRNCIVSPQNPGLDLFHVNNSVHITDLSFQGQESQNGAAVVAFQPLLGVATDRFFDAARIIRMNLDFIASETVGYLTSTDYRSPAFVVPTGNPNDCKDDIKDILKAVIHDITRGGNSKCVGAAKSYYNGETLQHIVGVKTETIDALRYAAGIAKSCINNVTWEGNYQDEYYQVKDLSMQADGALGNQSIDGCANVVSAIYSCVGVVTTIINQGPSILGVGINTTYPGNSGAGSTIPNDPSFSPGVGPITQGPYIRNCTNFIPKSIGMRINGFDAEPGDKDDIGVTGSMSVDSYTQYNQGGIGVSISNGAYAQLVSIFTICNEIAIYTEGGGQCDLTNSNSSFGTFGLVSEGVGGPESKSIYRMTGVAATDALRGQNQVIVSGIGSYRPYDGQSIYFDQLYNTVETITVTDGGSGYVAAPRITIDAPTGPNGITAQATATVENGSITEITVITSGTQYSTAPNITIAPPPGVGTTATAVVSRLQPLYYTVLEATLPSAGVSTISLAQNLNNTVSAGSTTYFSRLSLQLTSSHAFEFIGAGNTIEGARPAQGGITIQENEVVTNNGGLVVYTSTDQAGNFRIGDGVVINQTTGSITGRDFTKALFTTITPFILALTE